jgi:hypothetical protein
VADSLENTMPKINNPGEFPAIREAIADNELETDLEKKALPTYTTEKKQLPEPENVTAENTSERGLDNLQATATVKVKSEGFNLWRIARIGVRFFGKLNERDIALDRNFTGSGQTRPETINEQGKIKAPTI